MDDSSKMSKDNKDDSPKMNGNNEEYDICLRIGWDCEQDSSPNRENYNEILRVNVTNISVHLNNYTIKVELLKTAKFFGLKIDQKLDWLACRSVIEYIGLLLYDHAIIQFYGWTLRPDIKCYVTDTTDKTDTTDEADVADKIPIVIGVIKDEQIKDDMLKEVENDFVCLLDQNEKDDENSIIEILKGFIPMILDLKGKSQNYNADSLY
ncbi:8177_t:CDS:2 [Cetraspora pellucida]|uniref:8177_t:CDS:1 n=1 Tax=Cetraspora pellucida TaxID=1433469 RepID=A0A9N9F124_9GLOM|nr:8177_t:CDS:2 [Cetraspora pellucida]